MISQRFIYIVWPTDGSDCSPGAFTLVTRMVHTAFLETCETIKQQLLKFFPMLKWPSAIRAFWLLLHIRESHICCCCRCCRDRRCWTRFFFLMRFSRFYLENKRSLFAVESFRERGSRSMHPRRLPYLLFVAFFTVLSSLQPYVIWRAHATCTDGKR